MTQSTPILFTRQGRFVDSEGRQVILHGLNLVNKDPQAGYLGPEGPETFAAMRAWGFNVIRLGVIWDGLEPEPGVFNETYLEGIDRQVAWAREAGLLVFLDMHQDLYSVLYADGAPEWATLTDGLPHIAGTVWSDAYFTSPAVARALENFWKNAPAPDGLGLQDHYARAWEVLARRFAGEPAVIGYDLMNEPFPGPEGAMAQMRMLEAGAAIVANREGGPGALSIEALAGMWLDERGRATLLGLLERGEDFARVVDSTYEIYAAFEAGPLMDFYRRVAGTIRGVDREKILFLNTSVGANMGVRTAIEPLAWNGARDPQQAYAPHGYDLVVDTPTAAQASSERVDLIFRRHGETAQKHNWPMLVGEWGAYYNLPGTLRAARAVVRNFERLLCGETYWSYTPGIEWMDYFKALHRPFPERVAGRLERYGYDETEGAFTCEWQEAAGVGAETVVYLPDWMGFSEEDIELTPASAYRVERGTAGSRLRIAPTEGAASRRLRMARGGGPVGEDYN